MGDVVEARSRRLGLQRGNSVGRAVLLSKGQAACRGVPPNEDFPDQKCRRLPNQTLQTTTGVPKDFFMRSLGTPDTQPVYIVICVGNVSGEDVSTSTAALWLPDRHETGAVSVSSCWTATTAVCCWTAAREPPAVLPTASSTSTVPTTTPAASTAVSSTTRL